MVGHIAPQRRLVPESVAFNVGALGLAGDGHISTLDKLLLDGMACRWTATASDAFVCDEKGATGCDFKKLGSEAVKSHSRLVIATELTDERVVGLRL